MTLTRRGLAALTVAIAALTTISTGTDDLPNTGESATCQTVDIPEDTEGTGADDARVADLIARGWYGDPTDHAERLYSPACR